MKYLVFIVFIVISNSSFGQLNAYLVVLDKNLSHQELRAWNATNPNENLESLSRTKPYYEVISDNRQILEYNLKSTFNVEKIALAPSVEYRETTPDDNLFFEQWGLDRIGATSVWDQTTGGTTHATNEEIVIAILDNGFLVDHPDLQGNIWTNEDEIPGNGIDDDNNGYVDDYRGYNTINNNDQHQAMSHGTKTVGILGAKGNNGIGISGVNWNIKVMLLGGVDNAPRILEAYEYIIAQKTAYINSNGERGANVLVTSFSGGIPNQAVSQQPEWCDQYDEMGELGILSVSAATNTNEDFDVELDLPTRCPSKYLIVATNSNQSDQKVTFAGYSSMHIDLAAPGEDISTLTSDGDYGSISGTSASCPHVAGGIALLYSLDCDIFSSSSSLATVASNMKEAVLTSVTPSPSLNGITTTGGILNLKGALENIRGLCGITSSEPLGIYTNQNPMSIDSLLSVGYSADSSNEIELALYTMNGQLLRKGYTQPDIFNINDLSIPFQGYHIPAGLYILVLDNGEDYAIEKIAIVN